MMLPPDVATDIPFDVVDMTFEEKEEIKREIDPANRRALEAKYTLVYEGPRFSRRYDLLPEKTGQMSLEHARHPPPLGASTRQVAGSLTATPQQSEAAGQTGEQRVGQTVGQHPGQTEPGK